MHDGLKVGDAMIGYGVDYLELDGSPCEMGSQHGESLRSKIRQLAEERLDIILSSNARIKRQIVKHEAEKILAATRATATNVFIESEATSEAAAIPHWMLLVAGGFSDLIDCVWRHEEGERARLSECTLWSSRSKTGAMRLVGTWDSHASAADALILVRRRDATGLTTLALSTAGWPMQQGITSRGLAFAIANLVALTPASGTSYICALPVIAESTSTSQAGYICSILPLCSARYFAFTDCTGGFVGVETDGEKFWQTNKPTAHTNHFVFPGAVHIEGRPEAAAASEARRTKAQSFAQLEAPDTEELFAALAFRDGSKCSIARSGSGRDDRTNAAFVLDPSCNSLHFTAHLLEEAGFSSVKL